jgi:hypothetical protein
LPEKAQLYTMIYIFAYEYQLAQPGSLQTPQVEKVTWVCSSESLPGIARSANN